VSDYDGNIVKTNKNWDDFSKKNGEKNLSKTGIGANYFSVLDSALDLEDGIAKKIKAGISELIHQKNSIFEIEYPCHSDKKERWFLLHISRFDKDVNRLLYCHYDITQTLKITPACLKPRDWRRSAVGNSTL
jgi:two-component system CheB/CheR fusion protein